MVQEVKSGPIVETIAPSALESGAIKRVVVVGHVDHGKSSLLGRLMLDLDCVPQDKVKRVEAGCKSKGIAFEPAFLLDALREEQEQGVTIDTTRVMLRWQDRNVLFIDAPGHAAFLKNMATGASRADVGLLILDCTQGIRAQTIRHLKILNILGVRDVVVAVNKMDIVGNSQSEFEKCASEIKTLFTSGESRLRDVIPISALLGDNILECRTPWYKGKPLMVSLMETADRVAQQLATREEPLLCWVCLGFWFTAERYFAGKVVSGELEPGVELMFLPSGRISRVESIERYPLGAIPYAGRGESVSLKLSEQLFIERGEVAALGSHLPEVDISLTGRIVWLSDERFVDGERYILKLGTAEVPCNVHLINDQSGTAEDPDSSLPGDCGSFFDVRIATSRPVAFSTDSSMSDINRFVLCSADMTLAAGVVIAGSGAELSSAASQNVSLESGFVTREQHEAASGHRGAVVWLTGLSGAGKTTLARRLERYLHERDYKVAAMDADNLRLGLCRDLGFSRADRSANILRIAHAARLFLDKGFITIVACISPYAQDRQKAREIIGTNDFIEVFVYCPVEVCQSRDPKMLYKKAASGEVNSFTGISAPYQPPGQPDLRLDSSEVAVDDELTALTELLKARGVIKS